MEHVTVSRKHRIKQQGLILTLSLSLLVSLPAQAITVVTSLPALSMIADQLLQGTTQKSILLVDGKQSPHGMALSPSQRQSLAQADLVLWVGPEMESWLVKPLKTMPRNTLAITDLPQLGLLPATASQQQHKHHADNQPSGSWDMHLWLDPSIMLRYTEVVKDEFILRDPKHADLYARNGEQLTQDIEQAIVTARQQLAPMRDTPLLTIHDAWRYFFRFFGLTQGGQLQRTPEESMPVHSLTQLERQLKSGRLSCLLREPQVDPKIIPWLRQQVPNLTEAMTDPLGQANYRGGYPAWLVDQASEIAKCRLQ
jgi:zinc transport system substrate-binding protein